MTDAERTERPPGRRLDVMIRLLRALDLRSLLAAFRSLPDHRRQLRILRRALREAAKRKEREAGPQ